MDATIISSDETLNYNNILGVVANTIDWQQHIDNTNGSVTRIKRGKIQLLFKNKKTWQLETAELYVDDGISYVENRVINIVANRRNE